MASPVLNSKLSGAISQTVVGAPSGRLEDEPVPGSLPAPVRPRAWPRALLVTLFFTALAVANSNQLAFRLGSAIGEHGDAYFSVWRLAWVARHIVVDPGRLFDANIFYPEAKTLAYSDAMLLPAVVLTPLHWLGVDPLIVYNLTLLGSFVLSGLAAYCLVRYLTRSTLAGLLGGVIFAFSPHRLEHFDHLELQFAFWIPLAVLAWHKAAADTHQPFPRALDGYMKVAVLTIGQVLSCIYHSVFLITWLAFVTALWGWRTPARTLRAGAVMLVPAMLVLAAYSIPYLETRKRVGERSEAEVAGYSARPADFVSAPRNNVLYGWSDPIGANERHLFPGVVAFLLVAIGLWPPLDRVRALHAAGLALSVVLALGFNGYLYTLLYEWVLPYRGLRVPARAGILILLGTAVLAGFGLTRVQSWCSRRRLAPAIAVALITLASVEFLATPPLVPVDRRVSPWYTWLRTVPDAVIFEWPVTVPWRLFNMRDVRYMYRSTEHWRPLLNGYSGNYPDSYIELLVHMRSFPDTNSIKYLQEQGATILILHEVAGSRPSYKYAIERLVRDPKVQVIAHHHDAGSRVMFFRLLPPRGAPPSPPQQQN